LFTDIPFIKNLLNNFVICCTMKLTLLWLCARTCFCV